MAIEAEQKVKEPKVRKIVQKLDFEAAKDDFNHIFLVHAELRIDEKGRLARLFDKSFDKHYDEVSGSLLQVHKGQFSQMLVTQLHEVRNIMARFLPTHYRDNAGFLIEALPKLMAVFEYGVATPLHPEEVNPEPLSDPVSFIGRQWVQHAGKPFHHICKRMGKVMDEDRNFTHDKQIETARKFILSLKIGRAHF
ncbi:hypothetical protein GOV09_03860 [Candidatus Woesearchaeota archaeon]|nr:hypothetical protein [Candidatus Woesearchaeota archaeon]